MLKNLTVSVQQPTATGPTKFNLGAPSRKPTRLISLLHEKELELPSILYSYYYDKYIYYCWTKDDNWICQYCYR